MDVLVIDDESVSRSVVAHALESAGYGVVTASCGEEALTRLTLDGLQLVVCDWSMPGMSGLELCREIRAHMSRRYIYILLLTSHDRLQDTLEGLGAGADDYMTKPFNSMELVLRVNAGRRVIRAESRDITIFSLAKLAESRDAETGEHLERVRSYCRCLAKQLQSTSAAGRLITDDFVQLIYETSPLHDIGKVAIPDAILRKPGILSSEEFEIMKSHTLQGARTLAAAMSEFPNAEFLWMAHDIALCHHEHYDGGGYPHGISGDDIPLSSRIVALADAYDALTTKRVYKEVHSHEMAKTIIVGESGRHFDPTVVEAFLEAEYDFLRIGRQHRDSTTGPQNARSLGKNFADLVPAGLKA